MSIRSTIKLVPILVVIILLVGTVSVLAQDFAPAPETEILWDSWGVPHIFAPDNDSLFYAFGWAQAHNHGDLILRLYGESRGRAAEYWGPDYLNNDILMRQLGLPQEAAAGYASLSGDFQGYMNAFAQGINDFAAQNPDLIGDEWEAVLPITAVDIVAHGIRTLRYTFVAGNGIGLANRENEVPPMGSNAWAIGPSRSASGNAMLVANPHQPWQGLGLWIEAHLVTPDADMYGAALVGNPVLGIAFNQYLGWTHTVNTRDGWDLYALTLANDGTAYVYDGETVAFETRAETVRVLQPDGAFEDVTITARRSVHGPVLAYTEDGSAAYALRVVAENAFEAGVQWWEMGHATNFEEFLDALRPIRIPMFTVMYADREGNIMHLFNEQVPIRSEGDWDFWNGTTALGGEPSIIPGDTSDYVWTEYHPFDDLPRVTNPESGWLQNANEPPFTTTLPLALDPADFPAYMLPEPYVWPRPQQSMRLLYEDESITYDELVEYKFSTYVELTNLLLDDLIAAGRESSSELVNQAVDVLEAWDRRADADSQGTALFVLWIGSYLDAVATEGVFSEPFDINDPINTPRGLGDPDAAIIALEQVATLAQNFGLDLDTPYGDLFRLRFLESDVDLPASGGNNLLGTFSNLEFAQDTDLRFRPTTGDSYIAVIEFGDPLRAQVLLTYGNSTQAWSPHYGDQLQLFADHQLRDAWLTRDEIEANLEDRTTFE